VAFVDRVIVMSRSDGMKHSPSRHAGWCVYYLLDCTAMYILLKV